MAQFTHARYKLLTENKPIPEIIPSAVDQVFKKIDLLLGLTEDLTYARQRLMRFIYL